MRLTFILFVITITSCTSRDTNEFQTLVAADRELFDTIAARFQNKYELNELLEERFVEWYKARSIASEYNTDSSVVGRNESFSSNPDIFIKIGGDYSKYEHIDGPSETYHFTNDSLSYSFSVYKAPADTLGWKYFTEISVALAADKNKLQEGSIVDYEKYLFFLRKVY